MTALGGFAAAGHAEGSAVVVAIRPQGIRLTPGADLQAGAPGRVISRHFLGEIDLFDVAVEGRDTYLLAKARASGGLVPGSEVRVGFEPRDVLVFPEE